MPSLTDCVAAEHDTFGYRSKAERLAIMMYELGAVARDIIHAEAEPVPSVARARYADALTELSDLLTQLDLLRYDLLDQVGAATRYTYSSLESMAEAGRERQVERMQEWKDRRVGTRETDPAGFFRAGGV